MATTPWVAGLYVELVSIPSPAPRPFGAQAFGSEERNVVPPILPPGAENYYADLVAYKSFDARAWLQQILDEETRRELLPAAPNAFDDWDWSAWFGSSPQKIGNEAEWSTFTPPALSPPLNLGWDAFEWNRAFGEGYARAASAEDAFAFLISTPFVPDDSDAMRAWGAQGFAGLLVFDEFVNAP